MNKQQKSKNRLPRELIDIAALNERIKVSQGEHKAFRDACVYYASLFRDVFLQEVGFFIDGASPDELESISKMLFRREGSLKGPAKRRGRPSEANDPKWIAEAKEVAWNRHVKKMSWNEIVKNAGMASETNERIQRTLSRRRDDFAELVYSRLIDWGAGPQGQNIETLLRTPRVQRDLERKYGLPFESHPVESAAIVRELFPIGRQLKRTIRRLKHPK